MNSVSYEQSGGGGLQVTTAESSISNKQNKFIGVKVSTSSEQSGELQLKSIQSVLSSQGGCNFNPLTAPRGW